jgi:hypothetical protein
MWIIAACVLVLAVGGVTAYALAGNDGANNPCGPQDPTGVKTPHVKATDHPEWLKLADSGMQRFSRTSWVIDQSVTFGIMVKNTSKYVLYGATIDVQILDRAGKDVTREVSAPKLKENSHRLRNLNLPVVFPGQEVGMGNDASTWESVVTDEATGKRRHPKPLNYDKLRIKVKLKSGEWWAPHNDVHIFAKSTITSPRITDTEPADNIHYQEGPQAQSATVEYRVDSSSCHDTSGYLPSAVVYDDKGHIVGGGSSGTNGDGKATDQYSPGKNDPMEVESLVVPGKNVTVKMFPYMNPTTAKLSK